MMPPNVRVELRRHQIECGRRPHGSIAPSSAPTHVSQLFGFGREFGVPALLHAEDHLQAILLVHYYKTDLMPERLGTAMN